MKILHVTPYFAPAWAYGGSPRAVYELAKQQVKLGHQVTVVTTDAYSKTARIQLLREKSAGIEVIRVRNVSNYFAWFFHFSTPLALPAELNVSKFDVIHLHEVRTLLHFLVLRQVKSGQQVCMSAWGTLAYNHQRGVVKAIFDKLFLNVLRHKVSLALAQTSHEVSVYRTYRVGVHQELVPLGIESEFFKSLPSRRLARQKLQLPQNVKVYLFLGRYARAKGIDVLIVAFARFLKKKRAVLVFVGRDDGFQGKMREMIKHYGLEDKVKVLGPLYDRERLLAYRAADVFVFTPTEYEETSTACLEALRCNTPVITTPQAEIPYFKPQDGVIHTTANVTAIAKALEYTYRKTTLKVNQALLTKYFDWPHLAKNVTQLYEKKFS